MSELRLRLLTCCVLAAEDPDVDSVVFRCKVFMKRVRKGLVAGQSHLRRQGKVEQSSLNSTDNNVSLTNRWWCRCTHAFWTLSEWNYYVVSCHYEGFSKTTLVLSMWIQFTSKDYVIHFVYPLQTVTVSSDKVHVSSQASLLYFLIVRLHLSPYLCWHLSAD